MYIYTGLKPFYIGRKPPRRTRLWAHHDYTNSWEWDVGTSGHTLVSQTLAYLRRPGREPRSPGYMTSLLQGPTTLSTRPYTGFSKISKLMLTGHVKM